MHELSLGIQAVDRFRVLCLGAHADDIEIGCGGTLLTLLERHPNLVVRWIVFSADETRAREARASAEAFLGGAADRTIEVRNHRDGFFPYQGAAIKEEFEALKKEFSPDLVFTHYRHDGHQDHRLLCDLAWNTFRNHLILEYEIPKYDGDLGNPNVFVPLTETVCERKVRTILAEFASQRQRQWFDEETFLALLRLRGMEAASPTRFAEAFHCRKAVLA